MLSWNDYVEGIVKTQNAIDDITLQYWDQKLSISPIVKASVMILESMLSTEGKHNVFVFPETDSIGYEFLLSKVIFNITSGKIHMSYDPYSFICGQKLKYKNCVMAFDRIEQVNGKDYIFVYFSDSRWGVPIEIAPFLQIADSKKLSKLETFKKEYSALLAKSILESGNRTQKIDEVLSNHKTHLNGSVVFVSGIKSTKEFMDNCYINDKKLVDVLLIGHLNSYGDVTNFFSGQLSGNPAIVVSNDLYSVANSIGKGVKIQSVIVDLTQPNIIYNQLDVFDELSKKGFPILCVTDICNSFDVNLLIDRGYNLWRWDANNITSVLQMSTNKSIQNKLVNCSRQCVEYINLLCDDICEAVELLYANRAQIEDQSTYMVKMYDRLFSIAFDALRYTIPLTSEEIRHSNVLLDDCEAVLLKEKRYIRPELYEIFSSIIENFRSIYNSKFVNQKLVEIADIISSKEYSSICIVIPDRLNKEQYLKYWQGFGIRKHLPVRINVKYPQEYRHLGTTTFDLTIIVGWLNKKTMCNILHSYVSPKCIVLTYTCEERWKNAHVKYWDHVLRKSDNNRIVRNSLSKTTNEIDYYIDDEECDEVVQVQDELDDIEILVKTSRYRQFSNQNSIDSIEAYPISFVGGSLAFYRLGHKVITATDIIIQGADSIKQKLPEELVVGDFVVVRDTDRDIIRDIADRALHNAGQAELRSVATKWKEALSVETIFAPIEEIHSRLKAAGCTKDLATIKNWLMNDEMITPKSIEDLIYIAEVTEDAVLSEKVDEIFEAGRIVKNVHVQAGRMLSKRMKMKIADEIQEHGVIDVFNIWDPITLQVEDIGSVMILKVTDIGDKTSVDKHHTNRLLNY